MYILFSIIRVLKLVFAIVLYVQKFSPIFVVLKKFRFFTYNFLVVSWQIMQNYLLLVSLLNFDLFFIF